MTFEEERQLLLTAGVRYVAFDYDGSGDSGDVVSVSAHVDDGMTLVLEEAQEELSATELSDEVSLDDHLRPTLWSVARSSSDLLDYDWYNNEGGGGSAAIDLYTGAFVYEGYYRTMDTVPQSGTSLREVEPYYPADRALESLFLNPE